MARGYIYVEGQGEQKAILNLINRLWLDLQLPFMSWASPIRGLNLTQRRGVDKICMRARALGDIGALLIIRDDDDGCPAQSGPTTASWISHHALPFPSASVMMFREYETLFLPCAAEMAGKPLRDERGVERAGLNPSARFDRDPESLRSAKDWLSGHMPKNRSYKPTLDQLPMTRLLNFETLRATKLPCFGSLERALQFLAANLGRSAVYPPPPLANPNPQGFP